MNPIPDRLEFPVRGPLPPILHRVGPDYYFGAWCNGPFLEFRHFTTREIIGVILSPTGENDPYD